MAFQFGGASATGRSHLDRGKACEDAYHIVEDNGGIVACVCDGAGSATQSAEGAASLALNVSMALGGEIGQLHQASAVLALQDAIEDTRRELQRKGPLFDFHSTLCGIAMSKDQCLVFHLGDGVVMGVNPDDWSDFVVSEPENGEFAETTYFFTLPEWRESLRVFCAPRKYRTWFLMSDGTASFAVKTLPWRPTPNFLVPVHNYLSSLQDTEARNKAILNTLQSVQADRITADDKTLVWVNEQYQN